MNDIDELWDNFAVSGSIADYLKYKQNVEKDAVVCKAEKTKEEQIV